MEFNCVKSDILPNIQQSQNIVGQRTTLQILSNMLVEVKGNQLYLTSTDLEIGMHSSCQVDAVSEGSSTIPAKKFFDIIRNLPDKNINVKVDENHTVFVNCEKSSYKIFGLPAEDFPALQDFSDADCWEFSQAILRKIIKQTNYAISRDESRYVLNGIYLILQGSEVTGVATDGRRLSLARFSGMDFPQSKVDFILPAKTVNELQKVLSDEGNVKIKPKGNQVCFEIGATTIVSKLIEGNFPEYKAVIPSESPHSVIFNKEDIAAALNRVSILTSDRSNSIKLLFADNTCTITANSPSIGEAKEELEVQYSGPEMPVAFNPHYLLDIIKCLDDSEIVLELSNSLKPGVIRKGEEFLAVIMPMRLE